MLMMKKTILALIVSGVCIPSFADTNLTIEELRIEKAISVMPKVTSRLAIRLDAFSQQLIQATNFTVLNQLVIKHGREIWQDAVLVYKTDNSFDDRPLYWARLQMFTALKQSAAFIELLPIQQDQLLWRLELYSRGQSDVTFNKKTTRKILITGFDPFFLDRNIDQSNPSGVAALALDGLVISNGELSAQIETLMIPVRFADFDQGMIEELLTPYFKDKSVDMIITISMGRENFDLERFPSLRRSAKAPDNLNVFTGATAELPLIPLLKGKPLTGAEFVEFSLPFQEMMTAKGQYKINYNGNVSTLTASFSAKSLEQLDKEISVQGSGGGYLSNEISYRSIVLRNTYNPILPVGHIHTPRIKAFEPKATEQIIAQIKTMLILSLPAI
ncbi:MAG: pyrrolidone-carboxylate peptidase [Alteromonadaceae bacterium]|jgi:pyrrolidone-carboxylate peptidase